MFGGYQPHTRQCTNDLFSLKFMSEPCPITDSHRCSFSRTPVIDRVNRKLEEQQKKQQAQALEVDAKDSNEEDIENQDRSDVGADSHHQQEQDKLSNLRVCNVTPMRRNSRRSRLGPLADSGNQPSPKSSEPEPIPLMNRQQSTNGRRQERNYSLNESMMVSPGPNSKGMDFSLLSGRKASKPKMKKKRVSIVQTPVRARQCLTTDVNHFSVAKSTAAHQKIDGLDPHLVHQLSPTYRASPRSVFGLSPESRGSKASSVDINDQRGSQRRRQRSVHSQFINTLLLNFDESMLGTDHPFMLEPHQVIELLHRALPLIEADATLTRIEAPAKVFGDIHGQLGDLMSLFKRFGYPDANIGDIAFYKYVFLGDFVDRGHKCLEVMCLLMALKIKYPKRVFLIRGNHECHAMNEQYGFYHEINDRLFPNVDTLKYIDCDDNLVLNNNFTERMDEELTDYQQRVTAKRKQRQQLTHNLMHDVYDDYLDIDLEYDEVEVPVGDCFHGEDIISRELNFLDDDDAVPQHNTKNKAKQTKMVKRYKSRKYFRDRCDCLKYLIQSFELTFRWLPLGVLVSEKILCVHGGIGQIETIEEIEAIERPCDVVCDMGCEMDENQKKVVDLLWSDPAEKDTDIGYQPNKRGVSCVFGSDIVRNFCIRNKIDLIIRGHQVVKDGYEYFAGGHLITLFSATNYCNVMDNAGAILCIDDKLRVLPKLVEARPINNNSPEYEEDDEEESEDNLQWRKLKQFPPSPMRGDGTEDGGSGVERDEQGGIQLQFDDEDSSTEDMLVER